MSTITQKKIKSTLDPSKQVIYFDLVYDGDITTYGWHANTPILTGQDLTDYLNNNIDNYYKDILIKKYPGAIVLHIEGNTPLEDMQEWVTNGHKNITIVDEEEVETIIDEVPFVNTYPLRVIEANKVSSGTLDLFDNASTIEELKTILRLILIGD